MASSINKIHLGGIDKEIEDSVARGDSTRALEVTEEIQNQLDVLDTRVEQIARLPEGSTTGDAELIDIRTDYNGDVHANAGTSVREQARVIKDKFDTRMINFDACVYPCTNHIIQLIEGKYITEQGELKNNNEYATIIALIEEGKTYRFRYIGTRNFSFVFDCNMKSIANLHDCKNSDGTYTMPNKAKFVYSSKIEFRSSEAENSCVEVSDYINNDMKWYSEPYLHFGETKEIFIESDIRSEQLNDLEYSKEQVSAFANTSYTKRNYFTKIIENHWITPIGYLIYDSENGYDTVIGVVEPGKKYALGYITPNFQYVLDKDKKFVCNISSCIVSGTDAVIEVPENGYYIAMSTSSHVLQTNEKLVCIECEVDIKNDPAYNIRSYPFNTIYENKLGYHAIMDRFQNDVLDYMVYRHGTLNKETRTVTNMTNVNDGLRTNEFFCNASNLTIKVKATFSVRSCWIHVAYYNSSGLHYIPLSELTSGEEYETSINPQNLIVYSGHTGNYFIVVNTDTYAPTTSDYITIDSLDIIEKSPAQQHKFYDEHLDNMMLKTWNGIDELEMKAESSASFYSGLDGHTYVQKLSTNNQLIMVPTIPNKALFCGNSLLLGMNTMASNKNYTYGMCATTPQKDFYYYVKQAILAKNPSAIFDRQHIAPIEQLEPSDSFETLWNSTPSPYDGRTYAQTFSSDIDLIILQASENVSAGSRRDAFRTNINPLLSKVRNASPNARIIWVYGWENNEDNATIITNACKKWGVETINIASTHTKENEAHSGQTYIDENGNVAIVKDTWLWHPGDLGMQAIANKIIDKLNMN